MVAWNKGKELGRRKRSNWLSFVCLANNSVDSVSGHLAPRPLDLSG